MTATHKRMNKHTLQPLTKHNDDLRVGELSRVDVQDESLNRGAGHLRTAHSLGHRRVRVHACLAGVLEQLCGRVEQTWKGISQRNERLSAYDACKLTKKMEYHKSRLQ